MIMSTSRGADFKEMTSRVKFPIHDIGNFFRKLSCENHAICAILQTELFDFSTRGDIVSFFFGKSCSLHSSRKKKENVSLRFRVFLWG